MPSAGWPRTGSSSGSSSGAWAQPLAGWTDEKRASEWCDKQVKFDPDLWIVEIEDREGRTFVDEPVI